MPLIDAYEKLGRGIDILATSPGRIKERLTSAFLNALAEVPEDALPPAAKPRWQQVWQRVTAVQGRPEEGRLVASIRMLDDHEATLVAEHIVTVYAIVQLAIPLRGSGRPMDVTLSRRSHLPAAASDGSVLDGARAREYRSESS
jgi:hypothetical protein